MRLEVTVLVACLAASSPAAAQVLPQRPVTWLGGRVVVGASASVAAATSEDRTYFNDGDYDQDTMRLVQLNLASSITLHARAAVVADLTAAGEVDGSSWYFHPRSLFVRVEPFRTPSVTVSAGILQPAFGSLRRRAYGRENLLVGRPLLYQYRSSLGAESLPRDADELVVNRGLGSRSYYYIGGYGERGGLPLVDPIGWSAGFEVGVSLRSLRVSASLTDGSISNPHSRGASGGWQASGRVESQPAVGLVIGASVASGRYLDRGLSSLAAVATANAHPREDAFGVDAEYSRGYWLVRGEAIHGRRTVPAFRQPLLSDPLTTTGFDIEGRYRLAPGLYAAARGGRLYFGNVTTSAGTLSWDAGVTRLETGVGWSISRGVLLKVAHQYNRRDLDGPLRSAHRAAAEILVWF